MYVFLIKKRNFGVGTNVNVSVKQRFEPINKCSRAWLDSYGKNAIVELNEWRGFDDT